jgi:hypothetical protein
MFSNDAAKNRNEMMETARDDAAQILGSPVHDHLLISTGSDYAQKVIVGGGAVCVRERNTSPGDPR